jgi:hypothetical protein
LLSLGIAHLPILLVKGSGIIVKEVVGSEVGAAPEPGTAEVVVDFEEPVGGVGWGGVVAVAVVVSERG